VVAMAVEEDVTVASNTHSLNDVTQQSTEDSDIIRADPQQTESNNLEQVDSDTKFSKSVEGVVESTAIVSHEQQVGMAKQTRTRSSHTPTFCKSTNYLKDVTEAATKSSLPVCNMEHVDPGLEFIDLQNDTGIQGHTGGEDNNTTKQDG